jgi:hypothetical protein
MARHTQVIVWILAAFVAVPGIAAAQGQPDVWRAFAEKMDVGTELAVRLRDGQRFSATLVAAREDALLVQPKTRVPVPVQPVPYDAILSLERRAEGGMSAGQAAAIGVASGAGTFFAILLILLATLD